MINDYYSENEYDNENIKMIDSEDEYDNENIKIRLIKMTKMEVENHK